MLAVIADAFVKRIQELLVGLTPVQSWQLAQAPAKITCPRALTSAGTPWR